MEKNNRISIRINGKDKPIEDKPKKEFAAPKEEKDFIWVLPVEKTSKKVVGLQERQKQHELRKRKQTAGVAPKLPMNRKKNVHKRPAKSKKKQVLPKKQWLSAFSAVVVGLVMGIIVLTMFTGETVKQTTASDAAGLDKQAKTSSTSQTSANRDLDFSLNMIQGAAFSTDGNAKSSVENLRDNGYPAVLNHANDKVYLFIGAAMDKSQAKSLGTLYTEGQDVYVKAFQIQGDQSDLNGDTRKFLGNGKNLLTQLIGGSVLGLTSEDPAFTKKQWNDIENKYEQWKTAANSKKIKTKSALLVKDVESAITLLKKNRKNPKDSQLWDVQQTLLEAVLQYKSLVES